VSLLKDNHKFGVMPVQHLRSSTVFHAGTIGAGARGSPAQHPVSEDQAEINRTVARLIMRLCEGTGEQQGEGAKQLALMMVEIISTDMYNRLPWPEEEFMKV
jgi:hypothetical protein